MLSRSRSGLAFRLTTLLALPYRSTTYLAPRCMLSLAERVRAAGGTPYVTGTSAALWARAFSSRHRVCSASSTKLAVRRPMAGPAPPPAPPAAPIYDKDGKELSKPTKRKVAVVVGYVGTGFHGWQQSTDHAVRTVEGVLETALWKSGAIADSNYGDLNKIGWGRTSRTDKGVHASKTVASAKLLYPQETFTAAGLSQYAKDSLNEHLPDDIRCFSVSKVPKSFRGRDECTLREYSYYLPKHMLPDDATEKFKALLNEFVGTHSFHNFASMKGRQLKEVRKRVQASIDKNTFEEKGLDTTAEDDGTDVHAAEGNGDEESAPGSKRERSKEWRTWRYKKKSAVDQDEEDTWYHKGKPSWREPNEKSLEKGSGATGVDDAADGDDSAVETSAGRNARESVTARDVEAAEPVAAQREGPTAGSVEEEHAAESEAGGEGETGENGSDHGGDADVEGGGGVGEEKLEQQEEGPVKVLMLRELRTSIYRCEVSEGIVKLQREGQEQPEEFVRIDIRGKAFVYNQIRLMIGGALCEARGELFPGFVAAALHVPYNLRVPLAPAEGLVLESQAFTRHTNAMVLDPRDLTSVGGTLAEWGDVKGGNTMQTNGRLQTLLSTDQFSECDRWRDEHIVPAVAEAWTRKGAAESFLNAVQKFFVGQQEGAELMATIKEHMDQIKENERKAEEKHNRFRAECKDKGSNRYKDLLPKNIATRIVCRFRLLPGNKVSAIQRGVVKNMGKGKLPALADTEQVLGFIEQEGVDEVAIAGGFNRSDIVKF